jgi:hypothetical protein
MFDKDDGTLDNSIRIQDAKISGPRRNALAWVACLEKPKKRDPGIVYKLQSTPDLVSLNYGATGAFVLGDGSGMTLFDPSGASTTKNYRVTVGVILV